MRCLGLDLGSTTIKGAVLDLETATLSHFQSVPFPAPIEGLAPGWHEVHLGEILSATRLVLEKLNQTAPDATNLFICSQMGGLVLSDDLGTPLTHYLSWRDQRTLAEHSNGGSLLEETRNRLGEEWLTRMGGELKPGSATSLLFWLAQKDKLPPQGTASSLGEWVVANLTNNSLFMHPSMAIGLLDLTIGDWAYGAFEKLGLSSLKWPQIPKDFVPVGTVNVGSTKLLVHPALGDQQCALFGVGLLPGELSINASTGSQVSRLNAHFNPGPFQSRFYFDDWKLDTITHIPAGRSLKAIVDLLTEIPNAQGKSVDPWGYIASVLENESVNDLDCGISFFPGPLGETGHLKGITLENLTVGKWMFAALTSMASGYRLCAERLGPLSSWSGIVVSGGLAQSLPRLGTLIQQNFPGLPIRHNTGIEETLMGLLRLAQKNLGTPSASTISGNFP